MDLAGRHATTHAGQGERSPGHKRHTCGGGAPTSDTNNDPARTPHQPKYFTLDYDYWYDVSFPVDVVLSSGASYSTTAKYVPINFDPQTVCSHELNNINTNTRNITVS